GIDAESRVLKLSDGELPYDILIVAAGARHSYFGHDLWAKLAPGLKSIEDATEIRKNFLCAFEAAERISDPAEREGWLTFVIVGGGPTGVELAGAISEIARYTLPESFRHVSPAEARVILVEADKHVLGAYPDDLAAKATTALEKRGVTVYSGTRVTDITDDHVVMRQGDKEMTIPSRTVLWAAGVQVSPLARVLHESAGAELDKRGRVVVGTDLALSNHSEIFVIGDMASVTDEAGQALPGLAPVAMQEGVHVARVIQDRLKGVTTPPFRYKDRGTMATIGRSAAVAQIGNWKVSGMIAWMMWLLIHVTQIVQFESRILVMMQWMWSYFTFNKSALLITHEKEPLLQRHQRSRNPTAKAPAEQYS
ncbi:NAD(P)/FAD-dependent oxidoreductase, partial [bacterium]|nr:NAD(P)/FAD-dependent oxidoreductase [bacterium]